MKKVYKKILVGAAAVLIASSFISRVSASGHFIAGLQDQYSAYDLNNTYVFESSEKGYTSFISSANPSTPGSAQSPANVIFGGQGLYNLHIARDEKFESGMTFVFSFDGQDVRVYKIEAPNVSVGEKGEQIGHGKIGKTIKLPDGIRVWTGRGEEPFFGNGVGLKKFNMAKRGGKFSPEIFEEDKDLFIGATASFIVVDIPNKLLGDQVKVFTTTSVPHKSEWSQVDRHANVLFPYVFLNDTPAVQEDYEQHRPDLDVAERRQAIVNNVFWAVSTSKAEKGNEMAYANKIANMVMPDVLTYRPGSNARYTVEELNGRALHDDAMNTALHLMMGTAVDDNANDRKRYQSQFPYITAIQ